ncbi:hypothetical protein NBRC116493_02410 [Aurantivibrio infirmus]
MPERILLEVDANKLDQLLAENAITVNDFSCVDKKGKYWLRKLFLKLLNRQLRIEAYLESH